MNGSRIVAVTVLLTLAGCAGPDGGGDRSSAPATAKVAIGRIDAVEGEGFVWHEGQRVAAAAGIALYAGDSLETGANAKLKAALSDSSMLAIGAGTKIELSELNLDGGGRAGRLKVAVGKFWMHIRKWTGSGKSFYEIETPNAVAGVRGTTLWGDTQVDAICSLEGTVEVRSLKDPSLAPAMLTIGNCAAELGRGKLSPLSPSPQQIQSYLKEVLIERTTP